ncbi:hypothetical protein B0F90DRAFT_1755804 [Multifurca ochricompacta]|uniref:Uncharacterized protein n=1 Tax=Multifurca ochricompacta TaxID=376703 RepID=A0AAD4QKJ8_9AGAM|nr:hypothetical protein B0F90DRAFT_1755804 [Multifurca ochricompacta]
MLDNSPPLPLVIYWRTRMPDFDTEEGINGILLALQHRDRVCRVSIYLPAQPLSVALKAMQGSYPNLKTLELCHLTHRKNNAEAIVDSFQAPNLRHLSLVGFPLESVGSLLVNARSLVTLTLEGLLSNDCGYSKHLLKHLPLLPYLKILKIGSGYDSGKPSDAQVSHLMSLPNLEEFHFEGPSADFEDLVARISAPLLKKFSVTLRDGIVRRDLTLSHLSRFISEVEHFSFGYARIRFQDAMSIVMDHDELWAGRGAFELSFNMTSASYNVDGYAGLAAKLCSELAMMLSTVQSLLIEFSRDQKLDTKTQNKRWDEFFRLFDGVKTLRVANSFVDELDRCLQPGKPGKKQSNVQLLPGLEEIVCYGSHNEFVAFVEARRLAGRPVRVVTGPSDRLSVIF